MCGLPVGLWVFVITAIIIAVVVVKLRGILKKVMPRVNPDNSFLLYLIISGALLFAAVEVGSFIREHNDQITGVFAAVRSTCE